MFHPKNPVFNFAKNPRIIFGEGSFEQLTDIIKQFGKRILIITGSFSFRQTKTWDNLESVLNKDNVVFDIISISGEPSPERVDEAVNRFRREKIEVVLAIGGGSVIDAGKAISAMLTKNCSVFEYLEGVGTGKIHDGRKIPLVAVPTTAGTGSEATKNAVLSRIGEKGFKKSLRHENFVPDIALIDPILMLSCPPEITAAAGMDAFTQLLEGYVSPKSSPMTDVLAYCGMEYISGNLTEVYISGQENIPARSAMAFAALLSGITLANAGLGIVHGLASSIGGYFEIPHGVICGTLISSATRENINVLIKQKDSESILALNKYARVGQLLSNAEYSDGESACNALIRQLEKWTTFLNLPLLSDYGLRKKHLDKIVKNSGNKNNPVKLKPHQIKNILLTRIRE
jgi:alcohol dehydrogenase class IV